MKWLRKLRRRPSAEELEEEVEAHLSMAKRDGIERGLTAAAAGQAAQREFGNRTLVSEVTRSVWRWALLDWLWLDLRSGWRVMRRSPVVSVTAVVSMAIVLGAAMAVSTWMNVVVLKRLPVPHPEQLVRLGSIAGGKSGPLSYHQVTTLRERQTVLSSVGGWLLPIANVEAAGVTSAAVIGAVDRRYFETFPASLALGRSLDAADWDRVGKATPVAVIGNACWREKYGQSKNVLGQSLIVEGRAYTVVGVLREDNASPQVEVSPYAFVPLETTTMLQRDATGMPDPDSTVMQCYGRLKSGVPPSKAKTQLTAIWPQLLSDIVPTTLTAEQQDRYLRARLQVEDGSRGESFLRDRFVVAFQILSAAVAFILLLVSLNVALLLLARAGARSTEISTRLALGAGRWRILQQFITEGAILGLFALLLGFLCSFLLSAYLLPFLWSSPIPLTLSLAPGIPVLVVALATAAAMTLVAGAVPGWLATKGDLSARLKKDSRSVTGALSPAVRTLMVATQVALALIVISAASYALAVAHQLRTFHLGFEPRSVGTLNLTPKAAGYDGNFDPGVYSRQLLTRIREEPGVSAAALADVEPGGIQNRPLQVSTRNPTGVGAVALSYLAVSDGFFETMKTRLLAGRAFAQDDRGDTQPVAVLSRSAAQSLFGNKPALGQTITVEGKARETRRSCHRTGRGCPHERSPSTSKLDHLPQHLSNSHRHSLQQSACSRARKFEQQPASDLVDR